MFHRVRRPSPALVVASLALFVSLADLGRGAVLQLLQPNSVGTVQLKNNAVTTSKLRDGAVTSAKVKDRTVRAVDLAPGLLPSGISGYEIVSAQNTVSSAFVHNSLFLSCPPGKKVIGGGGATGGGIIPGDWTLRDERPAVDRRHRLADRHDARESGRLDTRRADHLRHGPARTTRSGTPRRRGRPPPRRRVRRAPPP